jgi:hypothetical protein
LIPSQVVLNSDAREFGGLGRIDETVMWFTVLIFKTPFVTLFRTSQVEHFTSPQPFNSRLCDLTRIACTTRFVPSCHPAA